MSRETLGWAVAAVATALWLALCVAVITGEIRVVRSTQAETLIADIKRAEGFRGQPYNDTQGNATIGYGTRLPLTKAEGELLLQHRLTEEQACIAKGWPAWKTASASVKAAVSDAGYALGCAGLLGFDNAMRALAAKDYKAAATAFRTNSGGTGPSKWFVEEPQRVEQVIRRLK